MKKTESEKAAQSAATYQVVRKYIGKGNAEDIVSRLIRAHLAPVA